MRLKKQIYKGNKINFFILILLSFCETASLICISLLLEKIMSVAAGDSLDDLYKQIINCGLLLGAMAICYILLYFVRPKYRKKAMMQYKNNIYNSILKKNITDFNKNETSTYISSLTNDVHYIEENYIFSIFTLITQVSLFIATLVVMILYSPMLTLVSAVLSLLPLIAALLVGGKLMTHEKNISDNNASFMHFIKDNLIGFSTIKVFKSERKMEELFKNNNEHLEDLKAKKLKTNTVMEFLQTMTGIIAQFGVFVLGAYLCIKEKSIAPSTIILFVQLMNYLISPLGQIPSLLSTRNACIPLFKKIDEIIETNDNTVDKEEVKFNKSIIVNSLEFAYGEKEIIKGIDLKIEKNKSYAIVGTSGSGKTTLVNLMLGRDSNYKGNIYYDDKELRNVSIDSIYNIASFVEQNVFIFDDSIINNITMYSNVDDSLLEDAINKSGLRNLIDGKGRDYKCGENGSNLSGGEKQRISIARALIKESQIIFMDEATSALDNEVSHEIVNNVLDLENTTKVMITHRLEESVLKRFDEIIVLKNGLVVENGDFDTLISNSGLLKSLYELDK